MRIRKKTWSSEVFERHQQIIIEDFSEYKGRWKEVLNVDTLRLEIGTGKGDYWHGLAALYPKDGIVAMERDYTVASMALRKFDEGDYGNQRFIFDDAKSLDTMFDTKEIDILHLNFSDPWPKKRHVKRRLTHESKLALYHRLLNDEGEIWMKTDNVGLFEYSLVNVAQHGFKLVDVSVDFRRQDNVDPYTEYERKFSDLGQPIYRAIWRKIDVK
jgi:tRNA (guanine-N7-)-methyltransferase